MLSKPALARCRFLLFVAVAAAPVSARAEVAAPVSAEAELAAAAIRLPAGFSAAPVASEPQFANPVAFCFDPQGRIFVAETHRVHKGVEDNRHHMDWLDDDLAAKTVADRRAYTIRRMGDRIGKFTEFADQVRLLADRDGDGKYESSSVFAGGFNAVEDGAAAGVLWNGDRLWFTCIPTVWELRDADGDGQAEEQRTVATGFGVRNAFFGHDMHGLIHGPDGKIYFSIGDRGLHVETPEGVLSNIESGAVLRCEPDGSHMELVATGLRNPQELAFNDVGDLFTVDNNSDSGDRARLVHIVEGMDAGWRMAYQYLPDRGPFNREKVWEPQNDSQPASIVPPLANMSDGPSGLVYYPGTGMPAEHAGAFFLCDFRGSAGPSGVREFWVRPRGATYELDRERMFAEGVLATDCEFGPDGNLYIADWVDGWEGTGMGRIHRVTNDDVQAAEARAGSQFLLEQARTLPPAELLPLLNYHHMRVRLAAQSELVKGGAEAAPPLVALAKSREAPRPGRLHAIWAIGQLAELDPSLFDELAALCQDADAEVRAQAAKTLGRGASAAFEPRAAWGAAITPLLDDDSPRVRSFAAITLGKLRYEPALRPLLELADESGETDPTLRHAAALGLAGSQSAEALAAAAPRASVGQRLTLVVALARQKSPLLGRFLNDDDSRVATEGARAIWDVPVPETFGELAMAIGAVPSDNEPMLRRALAANVAVGSPENLNAVVDCALRTDLSPALREHAWGLARQWQSPSSRDPVLGQWRPLAPRPWEELAAALRAALPRIVEASASDATGLVVAAEVGVQEAFTPLVGIISSPAQSNELRSRALAAIGAADEGLVLQAVDAGLASTQPAVRGAARQMLAKRFPARAVRVLQAALESSTPAEQKAAMDSLAELDLPDARTIIGQWMDRLERGECPPAMALEVLDAAGRSSDAALADRRKAYDAKTAGEGAMAMFAACLEGGDALRGGKIFAENATVSCRRCHSPEGGEVLVGPSLADAGLRLKRVELLESIVDPNAKITEGFKTTVLQLDTGRVVSGIVRREDDKQAVLVNPEGKEMVVDKQKVEERFEGKSAMPEDVTKHMTPRELRDVVEYLSTLRTPAKPGESAAEEGGHGGERAAPAAAAPSGN